MDIQELVADPRVQAGAGAAALLLLVIVLAVRFAGKRAKRSAADAAARGRQNLLAAIRSFRDEVKKAAAASEPVFRKMDAESAQGSSIGHWRTTLRHRIAVRPLDFGAVKTAARGLGLDSMPVSDLEVAWRKMERQISDYNGGKLDASPTPIATIRQFEKDLQKLVVLANIALKSLEG